MSLLELLEWLLMDYVCLDFGGWENNEGGRGDITWELAADRIGIEHTSYYTESQHDSREY